MNDPVLRMLGLARRAGKLAFGDELVREGLYDGGKGPLRDGCIRCRREYGEEAPRFMPNAANVPFLVLPVDKQTLGAAIGRAAARYAQ